MASHSRGGFGASAYETVVINSQTINVIERDVNNLVLRCFGTTTGLTDGGAGYAVGCQYVQTDGSVATTLYINEGTTTSCDFNAMETSASSVTAVVAGAGMTGGGTEGSVTLNVINTDGNLPVGADTIDLAASPNIAANITWTKEVNHANAVIASTTANTIGGSNSFAAGAGTGTAAGGAASLVGGASSNGTAVNPGAGGAASISAGAAGTATTGTAGAGGAASVIASAGGASTGASSTGGKGGDTNVTAGAGGASSGGGDTGGAGGSSVRTAGDGGTGATIGKSGAIFDRAPLGASYLRKMGAPTAKTTNATLTAAEVMTGWITVDGAASATSTQTMPSGTDLAAAFPSNLTAGDCFDFSVINISTDAAENAIIAFGADITGVGSMIVEPNDSGSTYSAGTFRLRYSGANVWVMYRIG